jgi:hypothetical protein
VGEGKEIRTRVRALRTKRPPAPWNRRVPVGIGGLTCVGFGAAGGREFLLVISHDGRGVFALDGTRVARDASARSDDWHDPYGLTALGIGPLDGGTVALAGLRGGGLPQMTSDGWTVERIPVDWPDERIILRPPFPDDEMIQIHHETLFEVRAAGFSPSGAALVIASSGEFTLLTR